MTNEIKLEAIPVPVSDVERAKTFYTEQLGFGLDVDHTASEQFRVVQVTPPGSACSILFGIGIVDSTAGSVHGMHLVVTNIETTHADLTARGVEVTAVRHMTPNGWVDGVDPSHADYNSFADFTDPDGNSFVLQERGHSAVPPSSTVVS